MLEQTVEPPAVERAPGAVEVVSGLRLLPGVVVVLELQVDRGGEFRSDLETCKMVCRDMTPRRRELTRQKSPGRSLSQAP